MERRLTQGRFRILGRHGQGDAGLLMARLGRMGHEAGARESPSPQARERKLKAIGDAPADYVRVKA